MKPTQRNEKPAHNMRLPRAKPVLAFFPTTYSASSSFTQTFLISLLNRRSSAQFSIWQLRISSTTRQHYLVSYEALWFKEPIEERHLHR